jgi:hypothetical protein
LRFGSATGSGRSAKSFDFFQSTRPSSAFTQKSRAGSATRKIFPSTTTGEEYLFGPIFVSHRMFLVELHSSGGAAPGWRPVPSFRQPTGDFGVCGHAARSKPARTIQPQRTFISPPDP